jgi:hypothetical protein
MKEGELMMNIAAKIRYTNLENKHKEQQTITRRLITKFDNLAYISGPLSRWVRLSYFCSNLQKYIIKVPNGLQTDLDVLF